MTGRRLVGVWILLSTLAILAFCIYLGFQGAVIGWVLAVVAVLELVWLVRLWRRGRFAR